ncbi:MAG: porphobilinogen synthase [Chloroflexi bacterium]|nr:porphobilinogen synthase [Chloroflexota bacterium]MCL5075365.1 porphobilinogen synthase [Chloroflexota bacterium]
MIISKNLLKERQAFGFPVQRLRRLRHSETLRRMVRETELSVDDFIYPFFVVHGTGVKEEISSMPGVFHLSVDQLSREAEQVATLDIPAVLLFGLPASKDPLGSEAYDPHGIVQEAVRALKRNLPELMVITDVCLCEYTSHGHCGVIIDGQVDNDETLEVLARTAVSHAEAGTDIVAPSDMMDGRVAAIRAALDENGFKNIAIMAYAAKYASSFYGPFREAAESAPQFGDRRGYQMDPANVREALREVELDIIEGADIVMVKPALAYLDVISKVKQAFPYPLAAYNVSGEYAMVKAAARNGWLDEQKVTLEILTSIKRAGANLIISYHALEVAQWLRRR